MPSSSASMSSKSASPCPSTPTSRRAPDEAQQILDHAELQAETRKARLEPVLLQAREVGAALVDEATERDADLLVVGLPYRKRFGGDFAIGRTIPYVLKHAPCEVWVVREPIPAEGAQVPVAAGGRKEAR